MSGDIGAAVNWYLEHDRAALPHLFRILWSFWFFREHMGEARGWVQELIPDVDTLEPEPRAELVWTAQVAGLEVGDDDAVLAAAQRLLPLINGIQDPFLRAVSALAMAWMAPLVGDLDGALGYASSSLDQLRRLDEPFWTTLAAGSLGTLEFNATNYQDSLSHLSEGRDLADRYGEDWLGVWCRSWLVTLAVRQGDLAQARSVLDETIRLGADSESTNSVALMLTSFAWFALANDDAEQAALVVGAANGLRSRAGLRMWPSLRQGDSELAATLRDALGGDQYDRVFAAGAELNQQQAVALVTDALRTP